MGPAIVVVGGVELPELTLLNYARVAILCAAPHQDLGKPRRDAARQPFRTGRVRQQHLSRDLGVRQACLRQFLGKFDAHQELLREARHFKTAASLKLAENRHLKTESGIFHIVGNDAGMVLQSFCNAVARQWALESHAINPIILLLALNNNEC